MTTIDLKSFDSASALIDACLDAMAEMTERQRMDLRTELLREFGLPTMRAIATVHLIERSHAQRLREAFGEESAQRVLGQLRSEALRAVIRDRAITMAAQFEDGDTR